MHEVIQVPACSEVGAAYNLLSKRNDDQVNTLQLKEIMVMPAEESKCQGSGCCLAEEESATLGRAGGREGVQVLARVVGRDGDEGVHVRHHVRKQQIRDSVRVPAQPT